ncbi:hypothetical protein J6590_077129 [Homalodisca vitripennis]|nr:hypothetical protein J6590_077129 [Homalodisca vitripennis]
MRNYKRKTDRKTITEGMLQIARQKLEAGISIRQIAREFGVSDTALRKRLKQGFGVSKLGRFVSVFNEEQEK